MTRHELVTSKEYILTTIQDDVFNAVQDYLESHGMTQTEFAAKLGVTKGYVSQILNGDFDHRLSKLVELCLAIGKRLEVRLEPLEENKAHFRSTFLIRSESSNEPKYSILATDTPVAINNTQYNASEINMSLAA